MPSTAPDNLKRVEVVAAIVLDGDRVLISLRHEHLHQGGLWEFPGGKIENGESGFDALYRELREELGLRILSVERFAELAFDYPDKKVQLNFQLVREWRGEPQALEGQEFRWVAIKDLGQFDFPAANQPVVEKLIALNPD